MVWNSRRLETSIYIFSQVDRLKGYHFKDAVEVQVVFDGSDAERLTYFTITHYK